MKIKTLSLGMALAVSQLMGFNANAAAGSEKYTVDVDVNIINAGGGILLSPNGDGNYLLWDFEKSGSSVYICPSPYIKGENYYDDVPTKSFAYTDSMHVQLKVDGNVVTTVVNGKEINKYTDTYNLLSNHQIGFYATNSNNERQNVRFDNVVVTATDSKGVTTTVLKEDFEGSDPHFDPTYVESVNGNHKLCLKPGIRNTLILTQITSDDDKNIVDVTYDPLADTWVCDDELGRTVETSDNGLALPGKGTIGMFYYVWHGQHGSETKDITKILAANPDNPAWGGVGEFHWGGEPALGYYKGGDSYIIAKHMQMLIDAGIDFYYFDVTNAFTYDDQVQSVMNEIDRRAALGLKWPKLVFTTHSACTSTVSRLYEKWYKDPKYDKYWFYWDGKPLILVNESEYNNWTSDIKDHFTARYSWAWETGENRWPWVANYPQQVGYKTLNKQKINEQIIVSTAQHPYSKIGKSFHNGVEPEFDKYGLCKETPQGLFFAEQWSQAHKMHPPVVMVTQWNEWMAQRFLIKSESEFGNIRPGATAKIGETYFVDVYNQEFSRDIEPSKEPLIRDNYYLQLIDNTRKYKGVRAIPVPNKSKTIDLNGSFDQWSDILPEFKDEPGDAMYVNSAATSKRATNDIVSAKVTKDNTNLYFYVKTKSDISAISASPDQYWLTLLLNADCNYKNGWSGYNYMVANDGSQMKLYTYDTAAKAWKAISEITYVVSGKEMMLTVPKSAVALTEDRDFDFKWIDNINKSTTDILDFISFGDCAPNNRFNYRYKGSKLASGVESVTTSKAVVLGYAEGGTIHTTAPAKIYNLGGAYIGTAANSLAVAPGVYFIVAGGNTQKVIVK